MIDPLIPSVRAIFNLSYTQSMLTQFAFFMSYGIVSLHGAALVARAGYGRSILIALGAMIVGCLFMPFATYVQRYELVLVALFIIGSGITVLQVAANPLAAVLGAPERSHFRLTFSQAFNSLGTVIAPYLGSMLLLRGGVFAADAASAGPASRVASLLARSHGRAVCGQRFADTGASYFSSGSRCRRGRRIVSGCESGCGVLGRRLCHRRRPVQLHHVSHHLHDHPGAQHGFGRGDV